MEEKPKISYETLWKFIIRPPRDNYIEDSMGQPIFKIKGRDYTRQDYNLISSEGYNMKCSFFEPKIYDRPNKIMPVVLYLHGNSSSRLEGINMLRELLKNNINLFVVDFPGCGLSEGEYISLGYHESHDVKIIVDFIDKLPGVGYIGIWGRSMGAATTMIYAHKDKRIKAICMDSPFADFSLLAKELVLKQIKLPNFLIEGALKIIRKTIKNKNGLDINKLKPIDAAPKTTQPAFFIHANDDELIDNKHSDMLINAYKGKDKCLKRCNGQHNTKRPNKLIREVIEFFYKHLVNNDYDNFNIKKKENIPKKSSMFDFLMNNDKYINKNKNVINNKDNIKDKQKEVENNDKTEINSNEKNENIFDNEKYMIEKDEKNKKEMELLNNELSKCFGEYESKNNKRNIDVNNDFDEK